MTRLKRMLAVAVTGMWLAAGAAWADPIQVLPGQAAPAGQRTAVVFIHGVLGEADATWRVNDRSESWPQLLATDPELPPSNVYVLGYRSHPLQSGSNIEQVATRLLQQLRDEGVFKKHDKVALIGHSMGGLVAKRMVLSLRAEGAQQELAKLRGVIFLSTPAHGAEVAGLAKWLSLNPQFKDLQPAELNTFLQTLHNDWQRLRRDPAASRPRAYCAYETLSTWGAKVVPLLYAERECDGDALPLDRDHFAMAKPTDRKDELYRWTASRLRDSWTDPVKPLETNLTVVTPDGRRLKNGDALRSGDKYWLEFETNQPTWLYLFNEDGNGVTERYYPAQATGDGNPVNGKVRIPGDRQNAITLNQVTGNEKFLLFAGLQRDDCLEKITREIADHTRPAAAQPTLGKRVALEVKARGGAVTFISDKAAPLQPQPTRCGAAPAILVIEHQPSLTP